MGKVWKREENKKPPQTTPQSHGGEKPYQPKQTSKGKKVESHRVGSWKEGRTSMFRDSLGVQVTMQSEGPRRLKKILKKRKRNLPGGGCIWI